MLKLVQSLLKSFGAKDVYGAADGQAGFESYCRNSPDLVIADWMMEPLNGIEFAELVRNDPRSPNKYVPIILMTGFSQRERVIEARDCGVTEFLVKPFNARDLYKRIAEVIEKPRQFVKSEKFFGPDRRRRDDENHSTHSRESDKK